MQLRRIKVFNKLVTFRVVKTMFKTVPFSTVYTIFYCIFNCLFPALVTYLTAHIFEYGIQGLSNGSLIFSVVIYIVILLLVYVVLQFLSWGSSLIVNANIYEKFLAKQRILFSEKTAHLPLIYLEDAKFLDHQNRAFKCIDNEILSSVFMREIACFSSAIGFAAVTIVLASYNYFFILISILSVMPFLIVRLIQGKILYKLQCKQSVLERQRDYFFTQFSNKQSQREMRLYGAFDFLKNKWECTRNDINKDRWRLQDKEIILLIFCNIIKIIGYIGSIFLSLILVLNGSISFGVFGACISSFVATQNSAKQFFNDCAYLIENRNYIKDFFSYMDKKDIYKEGEKICGIESIVLQNIDFQYPNCEKLILKDLFLEIKKGEKIAVVGENGCGKTTLIKLLLGLYPFNKGKIKINNIDIQNIDMNSYYMLISVVMQNFMRIKFTLRENIVLSDISNEEKIEELIDWLNIDLKDVDKQIGQEFSGIEFSGGEWQKIALSRAIYRNSDFIILDEPTSALDPTREYQILDEFLKLIDNKTALVISHRIGMCKLMDKIIVMENGSIKEIGTHNELLSHKGLYYSMFCEQSKYYI